MDGAKTEFAPLIRFREFGDSNINFTIIMRVKSVVSQYILKHEFIKALHKRFKAENINIAFPTRTIQFDEQALKAARFQKQNPSSPQQP